MNPISVVVVTFDRPQFLERTAEACLSQMRKDDELIIVNDGGEHPILPEGIRYLWQPRMGYRLATARNRGIAKAVNPFILMLDDDTVPQPGCLDTFRSNMKRGVLLLGGLEREYDVGPSPAPGVPRTWQSRTQPIPILQGRLDGYAGAYGSNVLFAREDAIDAGGFDTRLDGCWGYEDSLFVRAMLLKGAHLQPLFTANALHLWHPNRDIVPECVKHNRAIARALAELYENGEYPEFNEEKYR